MAKEKPLYIIVAGVNGAGKSTLFQIFPERFAQTKRVNADEILRENQGDWQNPSDNTKAGKTTVRMMNNFMKNQIDFHQETTLAGSVKGHLRRIQKAKENDFEVRLFYVALDSPNRAIERVNQRVQKGGHGIPKDVITNRYFKSLENLKEIIHHVDDFELFVNNSSFIQEKSIKQNQLNIDNWLNNHTDLPRKEEILMDLSIKK